MKLLFPGIYSLLRRLYALGIVCLISGLYIPLSQAQDAPPIPIREQVYDIEIAGNTFRADMYWTISPQSLSTWELLFPLPEGATDAALFLENQVVASEVLTGDIKNLTLYDVAAQKKDASLLQYAGKENPILFVPELLLYPGENLTLKLQITAPVTLLGEVSSLSLQVPDILRSRTQTRIRVSLDAPDMPFFWSNLPDNVVDIARGESLGMLAQLPEGTPAPDPLSLLWSEAENPVLSFSDADFTYEGKLWNAPTHVPMQDVVVLVDGSGSMYGDRWNTVEEFVYTLLERFSGIGSQVQMGLLTPEGVEWVFEDIRTTTTQDRQTAVDAITHYAPTGTVDYETVLSDALPIVQAASALFVIGDDVSPFMNYLSSTVPTFWLPFFDEGKQTPPPELLFKGDGWENLFTVPQLTGAFDHIWQALDRWRKPFALSDGWIPARYSGGRRAQSFLLTSRVPGQRHDIVMTNALFLPRLWAAQQITHYLSQEGISDDTLNAVLSLARTYGVELPFITPFTSKSTLQTWLQNPEDERAHALRRAKGNPWTPWPEGTTHIKSTLLYADSDGVFVPLFEQIAPQNIPTVEVAPWSAAHRELFFQDPELFAPVLGAAEQVYWCLPHRCVRSVRGAREESVPSDRLFFDGRYGPHWSARYLAQAVDRGILTLPVTGNLRPDDATLRGEFAVMIARTRWPQELQAQAETPTMPIFTDIPAGAYYERAIALLQAKGLVQGYADGTFRPEQSITRAEAIKILLAAQGFTPDGDSLTPGELPFSDITGWEAPWVMEAHAQGLVQGYADGTFRPASPITRAEAVKILLTEK